MIANLAIVGFNVRYLYYILKSEFPMGKFEMVGKSLLKTDWSTNRGKWQPLFPL